MDFAPTFLAAAGIDYNSREFDGESLLSLASGQAELERDAIFLHFPHYCYHGKNDMASVVRVGDLKYIHHWDNADHELFDLRVDVGERNNLYSAKPTIVGQLKARLDTWLRDTEAELPRRYETIPAGEMPGKKRAS
jgi:arylsulfatase A-like enzyme